MPNSPRWLSPGRTTNSTSGNERGGTARVLYADERVGVAVPPVHRHGHVGQMEAPGPTEQDDVVDEGAALVARPGHQVVDEHGLDFGLAEDAAVALGQDLAEGVEDRVGDRRGHLDQIAESGPERDAQQREHGVVAPGRGQQAVHLLLVAGRGHDRPEQPGRHHARRQFVRAGQRVRTAPRQPDHHEALVAQPVGDLGHVGRPVAHVRVGVVGGVAHARALQADEPQAEFLGGPAADERDLPAGARRAVEPQHQRPGGVAVLGEAQPASVGQGNGAFEAGRWAGRDAER